VFWNHATTTTTIRHEFLYNDLYILSARGGISIATSKGLPGFL